MALVWHLLVCLHLTTTFLITRLVSFHDCFICYSAIGALSITIESHGSFHLFFSASVTFNFDFCDYADQLITAITNFEFGGELESIVRKYLDLDNNPILPTNLTATIINELKNFADGQVNSIKSDIIAEINNIPCDGRRLEMYEVDGDGTQRMLSDGDVTFKALEKVIESISNVQQVSVGYFVGRNEIAMDVGIHLEQNLSSTKDFEDALNTVFGYLDDAKAMFGKTSSDKANVTELLENAFARVELDLAIR